jgi:hypothetical protein
MQFTEAKQPFADAVPLAERHAADASKPSGVVMDRPTAIVNQIQAKAVCALLFEGEHHGAVNEISAAAFVPARAHAIDTTILPAPFTGSAKMYDGQKRRSFTFKASAIPSK